MDRYEALSIVRELGSYTTVAALIDAAERLLAWVEDTEQGETDEQRARRIMQAEYDNPTSPLHGPSGIQMIKKLRAELRDEGKDYAGLQYCKDMIDFVNGRVGSTKPDPVRLTG